MTHSRPEWIVHGAHKLSGSVKVMGSKNGALAVICASVLASAHVMLANVPRISDVEDMVTVLRSIGMSAIWHGSDTLCLSRPGKIDVAALDNTAARRTRGVVLLMACLAGYDKDFVLPLPGGCQLGERSLEPHIDALTQLGLQVEKRPGEVRVSSSGGIYCQADVTLSESGDTVTENAILAAVALQRKKVRIRNASCNYMVQDLCRFLRMLGVTIEGLGSPSLTIRSQRLTVSEPISFTVLEDPIEAFFFIAAAVVTRSDIRVQRVPLEFLSVELLQIKKMGLLFRASPLCLDTNESSSLYDLDVCAQQSFLSSTSMKISPNVYPYGINVDNIPAFGPIAAVSQGTTLIHDWMYEQRASYFGLLRDFGTPVDSLDTHRVHISESPKMYGADVELPPALRPASMVLLMALAATGESRLRKFETLHRGYAGLYSRLNQLGAQIDKTEERIIAF